MQRIAISAVVFLFAAALSPATRAQTPPAAATEKSFSFCTVHDVAGRKLWASPVFEYESGQGWSRTEEMATDFHQLIGSMGGAGDKTCSVGNADRATVETWRNEQRTILTARFMGLVSTNKWMDVAWTPKPWAPALLLKPSVVRKFFYCYGTDTDQRSTTASTVATLAFEMDVDGTDPMAVYMQAEEYGKEFAQYVVTAHGLTQANPACYFKDTQAEAVKTLRDYRKMFGGFNTAYTDVAWRPTAGSTALSVAPPPVAPTTTSLPTQPAAAVPGQGRIGLGLGEVTPALALGLGIDKERGALVIEVMKDSPAASAGLKPMDVVLSIGGHAINQASDLSVISSRLATGARASLRIWRERKEIEVLVDVAGQPAELPVSSDPSASRSAAVSMPAAASKKFCHAVIQYVGKTGGVRSTVWENSGSDGSAAAMAATLTEFAAHIRQLQPQTWHEFTPSASQCDTTSGFCFATSVRHFGKSQLAAQFCRTTREEAETELARLIGFDRTMQSVAWPVAK